MIKLINTDSNYVQCQTMEVIKVSDAVGARADGGGGGNSLYFAWCRRAAGIAPFFRLSIHKYITISSLIYIYSPPFSSQLCGV